MLFSKLQTRILSALLSVALVIAPARQAHAVLPVVVPLSVAFLDAAGAVVTADAVSAAATSLIGGAALALILSTPGDTANVNGQVRIPLTATTPAAAISAPVASPSYTPLSNTVYAAIIGGSSWTSYVYSTPAEACTAAYYVAWSGYPTGTNYRDAGISGTSCIATLEGGGVATYAIGSFASQSTVVCSAGYVLSGSVCNLDNPRAAIPDNKQDFQRSGVVIQPFVGDDKPVGFGGAISTTSTANDTVIVSGMDSASRPVRFQVQAQSSGGSLLSYDVQKVDASGSTYIEHRIVGIGADGRVQSSQQNTTAQGLTFNTITNQYDLTGSAAPVAPQAESGALNIPTDYARTGEAATAAATLAPRLDQLHNDLNPAAVPADASTASTQTLSDALVQRAAVATDIASMPANPEPVAPPMFGSTFQPFTPGACSPLSYTFGTAGAASTAGAHVVNLDLCPYVPTIQRIAAWAMYLLTAGLLFQMFTRRPEGGGD